MQQSMYQLSVSLTVGLLLASVSVAACHSSSAPQGAPGGDSGGPGGTNARGGESAGGTNAGTGNTLDVSGVGSDPPPSTGPKCSSDLRRTLDENGATIATCSDDEGCAGGQCVRACDAAAQSRGSIGCEFWAPDPPFFQNGRNLPQNGACYAVFVANAWSKAAKIRVTRGGQTFDVGQFAKIPHGLAPNTRYDPLPATGLPPNEVAVLFLSHKPGATNVDAPLVCPVQPALLDDAAVQGSGKGAAFHVVSDTPVSAYDIVPFGGAASYLPSATLLLPAPGWGTNYVVLTPRNDGTGSLWALIVADKDDTHVTLVASQTLPGGEAVADAPAGQTTAYTLNAGETIQWLDANLNSTFDPTGTILQSDKPIGLWTGNTYLRVASATSPEGGFHDSAHQQIPHIKALGSEYVGAGIVTRLPSGEPESVPYKVLGVVSGTRLSWDPAPPPSAPTTLELGQVAEFETTEPFSVASQDGDHPFALTQYMPGSPLSGTVAGCSAPPSAGVRCGLGDEDWINLVAPEQFLRSYVFFTDPTYATTNLVLTRLRGDSGFSDVKVECLGVIDGWKPVGAAGKYEVAKVDLTRGTVPLKDCVTSRQSATSEGAFGVTVWGTDLASSYGYPAGGNQVPINQVVVPPIVR